MGLFDSLFGSEKKTSSSFAQKQDPWAPAVPQLRAFLEQIRGMQAEGFEMSPEQAALFQQLETQLADGNPNAPEIQGLASELLAGGSRSGQVDDAYAQLVERLSPIASGENVRGMLDNPQINELIATLGGDISSRINAQFAGAGRDLSGINQQAIARGLSAGLAPTLFQQYNTEQGRTSDAIKTLFGGGVDSAGKADQLDALMRELQIKGIDVSKAGIDAETMGTNALLNLEQQQKELPISNAAQFLQLLQGVGSMGGSASGTSKSTTTGSGGLLNNIMSGVSSLGTLGKGIGWAAGTLSDRREKHEVEELGQLADGTPIYRFKYKDDPAGKVHVGPMAQEVEQTNPEAVAEAPDGRKYVELGAATDTAAELMRRRRA